LFTTLLYLSSFLFLLFVELLDFQNA